MNLVFWRYVLILSLLYIFWGEFFVSGGILNQLGINFALFYPLGFLVGYCRQYENWRSAYLAALIFNLLSYVIASLLEIPIESLIMIVIDYVSLFVFLKAGRYIGQRAQSKE
ncbi:hypothetical protein [Desulfosporosinus sp. BICA1-9]|uniref:hypothetical protein n=1 Tax=Desulfosporosinus sp. BICA1-9 TaxID=1531958 RepID=UPI00054B4E18|nr:hypothetical protein [Desulfosporosinus sp. BICA1-9]KJS50442.1 MAG: membrane protein [Peptococcaceae bacterium BRH_c23]KJS84303.1 MAG: membrane protein [Desulfosporosinus sp. BICA1-9]KJS89017.1 MAG: membrane protein [Desulfosporosinus sp. BICA1-9]HBW39051.1 hypothetical protein [Desulfosporosinus sp.]